MLLLGLGDLAAVEYIKIMHYFTLARDGALCKNMSIWLTRGWKGTYREICRQVKIGGRIEYPDTSKNSTVTVVNFSRTGTCQQ